MSRNTPAIEHLHLPKDALRLRPKTRRQYTRGEYHVYAEACGVGLMLDSFAPLKDARGLAIIDVVCGAWRSDAVRFNEHLGLGVIDSFCEHGYHVFAVRPGSTPQFTAGALVEHVCAAVRHVLGNARHFGVNPERFGLIGASAGGHLAALAALTPLGKGRMPNPSAVGLFFPPADFLDYDGQPFDFRQRLTLPLDQLLFQDGLDAHSEEEIAHAARRYSPVRNLRKALPPVYLLHGDADPVVPLQQSQTLRNAIEAAGGEALLKVKAGGGHPWRDIAPDIEQLVDWFDARLP